MALKVKFNKNASLKEQLAVADKIKQDVIRAQSYAGEQFAEDCRNQVQDHSQGTYEDQTTNLRNSIGYFIRIDGKTEKVDLEGDGISRKAALSALEEIPTTNGVQLIGLAGMNYASHVESKGYNVMSKQADFVIVDLTGLYKAIENKYKR